MSHINQRSEQMNDSKQHTPTPWSVHPVCRLDRANLHGVAVGHPLSYEPGAFQFFDDDGRGNGLPLPESDREVNAAFLVRACNSHDALVAALRVCNARLLARMHTDSAEDYAAYSQACTALAAAEAA